MTDEELAGVIGENVRSLRAAAGLTQAQLGEAVGMAVPHVSRLEKGGHLPSLRTLNRVANALGVTVCRLTERPPPAARPGRGRRGKTEDAPDG